MVARDDDEQRPFVANHLLAKFVIVMNRLEFARTIAKSLTLGAWSTNFLNENLRRRLPDVLHRLAPGIIDELLILKPSPYAPSRSSVADALLRIKKFERAFRFCKRHQIWPDADLRSPRFSPIPAFSDLDIPVHSTIEEFADWLGLSTRRFEYLSDKHHRYEENGEPSVNHYHYAIAGKKNGGKRLIEAPKADLKAVQRRLLRDILQKLPNHPDAFGFVKGRNCLQAANRHASEEVVICFDLKNFFPSIGAGRIFGLFRCLGYPHSLARSMTALATTSTPQRILKHLAFDERTLYRTPHLAQGAPTSPALANHVAFRLDRRLAALGARLDAQYSRYADDLSFSGDRRIVATLLNAVPRIVHDEGFWLHPAKTRVMSRNRRQLVTGIVVNEHLNIDRRSFDHLKATIHACGHAGDDRLQDPVFCASLLGRIEWVCAVHPKRGEKLRRLLAAAWRRRHFE